MVLQPKVLHAQCPHYPPKTTINQLPRYLSAIDFSVACYLLLESPGHMLLVVLIQVTRYKERYGMSV